MKLRCTINGKEYDISQGATFTEEFSEILDSGVIIVPHVLKMQDLKPFDDVYVYSVEYDENEKEIPFDGFNNKEVINELVVPVIKTGKIDFSFPVLDSEGNEISTQTKSIYNLAMTFPEDVNENYSFYLKKLTKQGKETKSKFNITKWGGGLNIVNEKLSELNDFIKEFKTWEEFETDIKTYGETYEDGQLFRTSIVINNIATYIVYKKNGNNIEFENFYNGYYIEKSNISGTNYTFNLYVIDDEESMFSINNCIGKIANESNHITRKFYRHMLVDDYQETLLNLTEKIYTYNIRLFSETKYLERILLPNISITQPLKKAKKKSVWEYLNQYVNFYSPKIKYVSNNEYNLYQEQQKYTLDPKLEEIFGNTYAPDFSLNNPSLRDILNQLMISKDCIPYVKDNVICALNISDVVGEFDMNSDYINYIDSSMSSKDYTNNLKTNYNNALSQDVSAHYIEYLGFRNSTQSLLKIDNLRLETRFPIYKINKIYMCYFKKAKIDGNEKSSFLCQQDITDLVRLNAERNILSSDYEKFNEAVNSLNFNEIKKYKMATVGYDIGSKYITGWGEKYTSIINSYWDETKTFIQNILNIIDRIRPTGSTFYQSDFTINILEDALSNVVAPDFETTGGPIFEILSSGDEEPSKFKGLFFKIDYNAFYNGTTIHSKDDDFGALTTNDNPSSSLTILESDGIFEKEKINRLGNKVLNINARYSGTDNDYLLLQNVGTNYENYIIYRKEYSIYDNEILCKYHATKDFVMKSYYNSVYSKHRPFNLLSYEESVIRAENKKLMMLLSKDKSYYEEIDEINLINFDNYYNVICSSLFPNENISSYNEYDTKDKINTAVFVHNVPLYSNPDDFDSSIIGYEKRAYLSDINIFVNGYSLCFNMQMYDNVSGGLYIDFPIKNNKIYEGNVEEHVVGSGQKWYIAVDDIQTGFIESLEAYVCRANINNLIDERKVYSSYEEIKEIYNELLFKLPYINNFNIEEQQNVIGKDFKNIGLDNKEVLDVTYQIEPISSSQDVIITPWFMKLNDLIGIYNKTESESKILRLKYVSENGNSIFTMTSQTNFSSITRNSPAIVLNIDSNLVNQNTETIVKGLKFNDLKLTWDNGYQEDDLSTFKYDIEIINIESIVSDYIILNVIETYYYALGGKRIIESRKNKFKIYRIGSENQHVWQISKRNYNIFSNCPDKTDMDDNFTSRGIIDLVDGCYSYGMLIDPRNYGIWQSTSNGLHHIYIDAKNDKINNVTENNLYVGNAAGLYYVWQALNKAMTSKYYNSQQITFSNTQFVYPQNMFLLSNTNKLKKYYVIDELSGEQIEKYDNLSVLNDGNNTDIYYLSNIISVKRDETKRPFIKINLENDIHKINGFNILADLEQNKYDLIFEKSYYQGLPQSIDISVILNINDKKYKMTFNKPELGNPFLKYGRRSIQLTEEENYYISKNINPLSGDTIDLEWLISSDIEKISFIDAYYKGKSLKDYLYGKGLETLEYWYYDTDYPKSDIGDDVPYHKGSDSYHLVFAVNLTDDDFTNGYVKIYISLIENSNLKVYDNQNRLVGHIFNYAESDDKVIDGRQRYKPIE